MTLPFILLVAIILRPITLRETRSFSNIGDVLSRVSNVIEVSGNGEQRIRSNRGNKEKQGTITTETSIIKLNDFY